jgi:CBS domain-containing protein
MINRTTENWMSFPVATVTPETSLQDARTLVGEHQIRALPVVRENVLVGLVTRRGLFQRDIHHLEARIGHENLALAEFDVKDAMTTKPATIAPISSVTRAARHMLENKVTVLPVVEDGQLVGVLTNRDLMRFILSEYPKLGKDIPVNHYMTDEVITVEENTSILEIHHIMGTRRIRSLPVMRKRKLVGLITRTDLMSSYPARLASRDNQGLSVQVLQILSQPVTRIMTRNIITIRPDAPITEAARLMLENKVHCLPVMDSKKLVGIITESDLFLMIVQKFL